MSLINELRAKSANAEVIKSEVIAEIKRDFDAYLNSEAFENYLRNRVGAQEIKNRKLFIDVQFWAYHSGCSTTQFRCGGQAWYNPENKEGYSSHSYKGVELVTIQDEICSYISNRLKSRMNELGFYLVSTEDAKGRLNYYHTLFYFGW
jgi:hypothetical protein